MRLGALAAVAVLLGNGCGGCGDHRHTAADGGAATVEVEPAVPAPEGLLAQGWIRGADATWGRVQRGASGALALLPPSVGGLACALSGLDGDLAPLVDGRATAYVVVADRGDGGLAWALGLPLSDGARATRLLLDADVARYTARPVGGMRVLARKERPLDVAAALARGWLLLAHDEGDLERLGPYVYRTMPTLPPPSSSASLVLSAPQEALSGPLLRRLSSQWAEARASLLARDTEARARHGGRAPDFADPRAIVDALDAAVQRRISWVAQARSARLEIDAGDDDVHADVFVTPAAGDAGDGALDAVRPGDTRPLAAAPRDALVALLVRDDPTSRAADAGDLAAALGHALGPRLGDDDARAMRAALADWARGRGDWVAAGLSWGDAHAGWLRTPAADADAATRAVREIVQLARRRPIADPLGNSLHLLPPSLTPADVPPLGKATLATFAAAPGGGARHAAEPFGIAWAVHDGDLLVAAGEDAPARLSSEASPPGRLGDDPRTARALAALGADATFTLVAQPLRLDPSRGAASAPAVLAWGRRDGAVWAHADLADVLLRELVRLGAGF